MKSNHNKKLEEQSILRYIDRFWDEATYFQKKDQRVVIGLPNPFVAPNTERFAGQQFYWDSYFTILGLIEAGRIKLAQGMVDNLLFLFQRFGIIPTRNLLFALGASQTPFLTSMILEVYSQTIDQCWLEEAAEIAACELQEYWMSSQNGHLVYRNLSRFSDHYHIDQTAEFESGWDRTSRFGSRCLSFLPVDLNSCLYKYEVDLASIFQILDQSDKEKHYRKAAEDRRHQIQALMWDNQKKCFFDYDFRHRRCSNFYSLAAFFPLWAKLATPEQSKLLVKKLSVFEADSGLTTSKKCIARKDFKQWDYPNGWPNLQWIVVQGLLNYGFQEEAKKIMKKWLALNEKVFRKTGKLWEKYDVVSQTVGQSEDRYPTQSGFAWTAAVYLKFHSLIQNLD